MLLRPARPHAEGVATQEGTSRDRGTPFRLRWATQLIAIIGVTVVLASLVGLALFKLAGST